MTFSEALVHLKAGRQIKRKGSVVWLHIDKYGHIRELDFAFGFPDSTLWVPTEEDILAEDWEMREVTS